MRRSVLTGLIVVAAFSLPRGGVAKIDLVTLPARDETQITIYNSEDLTLTRERRTVTFRKGLNRIQFSWAGTLVDPTSPQLFFLDNPENFTIEDITYPANTQNLLQWNVEATNPGPARIEITCFISGVSWKADYVVKSTPDETRASIESYVRVMNNSGEDFENTQTRLVVGTVNLIDKIADLARRGIVYNPISGTLSLGDIDRSEMKADKYLYFRNVRLGATDAIAGAVLVGDRLRKVLKQAVSEYQLYTIEGTEDIPNGWSKRLRSFSADDVKIAVAYESNPEKYGPETVKLYKLKNDADHKLGKDPLPEGIYRVLREDGGAGLVWEGQNEQKYIPIGEKLEIDLGSDGLVSVEDRSMDFERLAFQFEENGNVTGWDERTHWRIEIHNSKTKPAPIKITRNFEGDWELDPQFDPKTVTYKKKDKRTVEFQTTVPESGTTRIEYIVTTHQGTRSDTK